MNNVHVVKRVLLIQSLLVECKVCLSHAAGLRWQTDLLLVIVQSAIAKECARGGRWKEGKRGSLSPFHHPPRAFFAPLLSFTVLRGGETRLQVLVYVSISVSQSAPEYYNLLHWLTQILLQLIIRSWKFEPQKIPFSYWAFSDRKHHKKSFVKYQLVLEPNFGMLQFN